MDPTLTFLVIDKNALLDLAAQLPVIFEGTPCWLCGGSGTIKADAIGRIVAAAYAGKEFAIRLGGVQFKVSDLCLRERYVDPRETRNLVLVPSVFLSLFSILYFE